MVKAYKDTVDVDMSDIMREFLDQLEKGDTTPDLGCGSGWDNLTLHEPGHDVIPFDASEEICKPVEIHIGLNALQMTFEGMELEDVFGDIWVCGSLFHVPKGEVEGVLIKLVGALCARGVPYTSVQKEDFEGFREERYLSDYAEGSLETMLNRAGLFEIIRVWKTEGVCPTHPDTVWINLLTRKKQRQSQQAALKIWDCLYYSIGDGDEEKTRLRRLYVNCVRLVYYRICD